MPRWVDKLSNPILLGLLVACALYVVSLRHHARHLYNELETARQYRDKLEMAYRDMERDQAMHYTQPNIEKIATDVLGMQAPGAHELHPLRNANTKSGH